MGLLPEETTNKLSAYSLIEDESAQDHSCWGGTSTGYFTVKSAYEMLNTDSEQRSENMWAEIWKLEVPNRVRTFLWLVGHKRIMSNEDRVKRGFTTDARCPICLTETECVDHIFRKCQEVRGIWRELESLQKYQVEMRMTFDDWLKNNLSSSVHQEGIAGWNNMFAITLWWIWKWRNAYVVKNEKLEAKMKCRCIKQFHWEVRKTFSTKRVFSNNMHVYEDRYLKWNPPSKNWFALNVDGSVKLQGNRARGGGILRNDSTDWITCFSFNWSMYMRGSRTVGSLQRTRINMDAWVQKGGIRDRLCDDSGMVKGSGDPCSLAFNLISKCRSLLAKE